MAAVARMIFLDFDCMMILLDRAVFGTFPTGERHGSGLIHLDTLRVVRVDDPAGLVRAAAGGDVGAWDRLVDGFAGVVWSVTRAFGLSHADAADVSQTTWLRLAENLDNLKDPARVGGWLVTTARREAMRTQERAGREKPTDHTFERVDERVEDAAARVIRNESDTALWLAFEALPAPCRALLRLLMVEPDSSYAQVGEALGMPIGSIGPRRARCLQSLRQQMGPILEPSGDFTA